MLIGGVIVVALALVFVLGDEARSAGRRFLAWIKAKIRDKLRDFLGIGPFEG